MIRRTILLLAISAIATSAAPAFAQSIVPVSSGAVYTMSNEANGNSILVFDRLPDGRLQPAVRVFAGGNGSGSRLGSQGGLTLTANQRWLLAVNAGSDTVSVLEVGAHSLRLVDTARTDHVPLSIATHGDLVYVLNGGSESIQGFRLDRGGKLNRIAGSARKLGSVPGTQPAQIAFSPGGEFLVVTEQATSKIVTFPLRSDGTTDVPLVQDSNGVTPTGFAFGKRDQLMVAESFGDAPKASATSSYELGADGLLTTISGSARDNQSGGCCAAITPDGELAFVANTGSGTISGYRIDFNGNLKVIDGAGVSAVTGGKPIDLALSAGGQFLYSLVGETNRIAGYRVQLGGSLQPLPLFTAVLLPASADGLAVR